MAVMKKDTRKKLSKQLNKLIKRHGAEMTLALITGIVSSLASDRADKVAKKAKSAKPAKPAKPAKIAKAPEGAVVVRKRAEA